MANEFRYEVLEDILDEKDALDLDQSAQSEAGWNRHDEWFFSQYDIAWVRSMPNQPFVGEPTPAQVALRDKGVSFIEQNFAAVLGNHYTVIGHKMVPGQLIGIHNDSPDGDRGRIENFRFIFYLDREFVDSKGGHLFLFGSKNEKDVIGAIRPNFNSGLIMELSDRSLHAVSEVKSGTRYCVVVSYWGYPIMHSTPDMRFKVRRCLKALIASGLEEKGHSGTTFLYHLYHTYRLLAEWGASDDVCLAGLMHSVLGRKRSGVDPVGIEDSELEALIGPTAYRMVDALRMQTDSEAGGAAIFASDEEFNRGLSLIEMANSLEQACTRSDIADAEHILSNARIDQKYYKYIEDEIAKLKSKIEASESVQNESGVRSPHHNH